MKRAFAFVLSLSILVFTVLSCNNSIDSMLDDYNSGLQEVYTTLSKTQAEEEEILQPGDVGFDENDMLRDEYFMGWDSTLNLYAPETSERCEWFITDPDDYNDERIQFRPCNAPYNSNYVVEEVTTKIFSLYAEECKLDNGTTYKLTLNVWKGGKKYTDICSLVVYQHYLLTQ